MEALSLNDSLFSSKFRDLAPKKDHVEALLFDLQKKYTEPHRTYHNGHHIENGLRIYFGLFDHIDQHILFAWAYHDAIYNPLAKDNEDRSAHLFYQDGQKLGLSPLQLEWGIDMILATKLNSEQSTIVNDMDLSVFGQPVDIYAQYRRDIRAEYPQIPDKTFHAGRLHVLETLQQRKPFFRHHEFYNAYEIQAGLNLAAEIKSLSLTLSL